MKEQTIPLRIAVFSMALLLIISFVYPSSTFPNLARTETLDGREAARLAGPAVYWSGPGGDMANTNSSPYSVDPVRPFDVNWAGYSIDGQYNRPSGIILADVGDPSTPYVFGSTGWSKNRPYRSSRVDGSATGWLAANGENDSGTGFRVAINPGADRIYHIDLGHRIRAYSTETDPGGVPLWTVAAAAGDRGIKDLIKVGPDGRIYGHYNGTTALAPADGSVAWESAGNPENAMMPGAFYDTGSHIQYVVAGSTRTIAAYDIATPSGSSPIWTYTDTETGYAGPTIDPATGDVYIFRSTRLIKLSLSGSLIWTSEPVGAGEIGRSYGALSRDGLTFYYQTGTTTNGGSLYAFNTADGSIKWVYPTGARANKWYGGPVVSANGLVFVSNGGNSLGDNMLFCVWDGGDDSPVLLDTFDMNDSSDSGGPSFAIGPAGNVYIDGWASSGEVLLYAFRTETTPTPTPTPTPSPSPTPRPVVPLLASGDYDGDGTDDIGIFRGSSGLWAVRGITRVYLGIEGDIPVSGDYDGDETTDIGIFRGSSSLWEIRGITRTYLGKASDYPVPGDYDGDGTCDIGVFRENSGLWAIAGLTRAYFGSSGDLPVSGDYDGDGVKEIGVFRGSSGLWAIRGLTRLYFGNSGDDGVPGDYDGDGTWEPGIFRPSSGLWAITGVTRVYYGSSSDQVAPADYDGDDRDDIGIFRDSAGLWAVRGLTRAYYGSSGDVPVTR